MERYLEAPIRADLTGKMVFLAGPRQVGKTTLTRQILTAAPSSAYLSWDNDADRRDIRAARWPAGDAPVVVLDELHKWRQWKRWLKGQYDSHKGRLRFLVTGSARLDVYRRGGDSLQGRYHHYRLHPLSYAELAHGGRLEAIAAGARLPIAAKGKPDLLEQLMHFGGFPEPCLAGSERVLRRWQKERLDRFLREDVRDLEAVRDLSQLQVLAELLTDRAGNLLSLNSLREDLEVSHGAVAHWIEVFERLFFVFRLSPWTHRLVRGLKKMGKVYLWDWSPVRDDGARFENLIASHLLKFCHRLEDQEGYRVELRLLRDRDGREVDFLVLHDRKPWFAVEAKLAEQAPDPSLRYFADRLGIEHCYQVHAEGKRAFVEGGVNCLPAARFLAALT